MNSITFPTSVPSASHMRPMTASDTSSLTFTLRAWVKKEDYWQVRFDLLEKVKDAFEKVDIVVPFPQMDVHMHQ